MADFEPFPHAMFPGNSSLLDAISEAIYVQDREGRFLYVNEGAARMYGHPRSFFLGRTPEAISAPGRNDLASVGRQVSQAFEGRPQQFLFWGMRANGEAFPKEVRLYPGQWEGQPAVIAVAQDVSERHRAEKVREATFRIAEAALATPNLPELYASIHSIVRSLLPADNFYIALLDPHTRVVSFPYWVDEMEPVQPDRPFGEGMTEYVLTTGIPELADAARLAELKALGKVNRVGPVGLAWLGVPLVSQKGVFGVLAVQSYAGGYRYSAADRDLLTFVSSQVAMAIERKRVEASHRLTQAAVDQAPDGVFGMERSGQFLFANDAACEGLGYTREELLALRVMDINPTLTQESWDRQWEALRRGEHRVLEVVQRRKDGSWREVEITRSLFLWEGREVLFSNVRDITARREAEEALRLSEEKFSKAFQISPDAVNITRLSDGTYLDVSEGFSRLTGWTREEAVGRTSLELGIWADPEDRARIVSMIQERGEFTGFETTFRAKDGSLVYGLMSGRRLEVNGVPCLLTFTRDITDRRQAEAALRQSERRLWTVMKHSQAIVYQLDPEGRFLLSEGLGLAALGLQSGQVVGASALDVYQDDEALQAQLRRALAGFSSRELTRASGRIFDNTLTPVFDEQGNLESVIGIALDVTLQQEAQQALVEERGLFTGGPVMILRWRDAPGWPTDYVSPNVREILGYPPELFHSGSITFEDIIHPEDRERIHEEARQYREQGIAHWGQEYRLRHANGSYRWVHDFTGAPGSETGRGHYLGYLLDITERRQAEEALRQSQKLESLGVLAGGIAHDFNNLLTTILGNLNLAQLHLAEGLEAQSYLENMETAVLRAAELTKQMLAYSGRGRFEVRAHDLNAVVRELTHLLEVSISKKVALQLDLDPDLPAIEADAAQIQQVVMNLVTNASDAIGDQDGRIRIHTSAVTLTEGDLPTLPGQTLAPGPYVMLEVEDTGCGMEPGVLDRIFDPFFTTKATGRGLGLSAMMGILRGHRAGLRITSAPGQGSVFRLYFPAGSALAAPAAVRREPPRRAPFQGRVLVVDDEELVLGTTRAALSTLGFEIITARDGLEALEQVQADPGELALVVMDLTMPRMDGREAFLAMRQIRPDLKVILCSGYADQDVLRTFQGQAPVAFLQKPYQIQDLRKLVQHVLEDAEGT